MEHEVNDESKASVERKRVHCWHVGERSCKRPKCQSSLNGENIWTKYFAAEASALNHEFLTKEKADSLAASRHEYGGPNFAHNSDDLIVWCFSLELLVPLNSLHQDENVVDANSQNEEGHHLMETTTALMIMIVTKSQTKC